MRTLIFYFVAMIISLQALGSTPDLTSYYKKIIRKDYTELDSTFKDTIRNSTWKLVAKYERTFLFFRKFEEIKYTYSVSFFDSTVTVNYDTAGSYTVNFIFDKITPELIIFKLGHYEDYVYQLLRFEGDYMVVDYLNINRKGRLIRSNKRLLFKKA